MTPHVFLVRDYINEWRVMVYNREYQQYEWEHKKEDVWRTSDSLLPMFTLDTEVNNFVFNFICVLGSDSFDFI